MFPRHCRFCRADSTFESKTRHAAAYRQQHRQWLYYPLQVLLQDVAWTEASMPHKREVRRQAMAQHADISDIGREPLFCIETALKVRILMHRFRVIMLFRGMITWRADDSLVLSLTCPLAHCKDLYVPQVSGGWKGGKVASERIIT